MEALIGAIIRHLLTAAAGAGFVVSQDLQTQIISAVAGLIGVGWSFWQKKKAAKAAK